MDTRLSRKAAAFVDAPAEEKTALNTALSLQFGPVHLQEHPSSTM
jgi:hypothetical protein